VTSTSYHHAAVVASANIRAGITGPFVSLAHGTQLRFDSARHHIANYHAQAVDASAINNESGAEYRRRMNASCCAGS